ncbi:MAG: hypothetical protein KJ607_02935 [Bacteroidetes bacterium]|nr:hypothetical protein [Bacteroidota bacterium]
MNDLSGNIAKQKYIKPKAERIWIDRSISFMMSSAPTQDDPPSKQYPSDDDHEPYKEPFDSPFK